MPDLRRRLMRFFPATVHLTRSAMHTMCEHARLSNDGAETGGFLFGHDTTSQPEREQIEIRHVSGPGPDAERTSVHFRPDLAHVQAAALEAFKADGSEWLGTWHTHLGYRAGRPSHTDLASWHGHVSDDALALPRFVGMILTPTLLYPRWKMAHMWAWLIEPGGHGSETAIQIIEDEVTP